MATWSWVTSKPTVGERTSSVLVLTYRQNGKDLGGYGPAAATIVSANGLPQIFTGGYVCTYGSSR